MLKWCWALVLALCTGCAGLSAGEVAKPACQVIDLANSVCKEFIFPSGEHVRLSPADVRDAVRMQAALKAGGSPGCK